MGLLERFLSLSIPWRILLSVLMVFFAGPGLIGVLSEYATYSYALSEHVRPPVEGIPYLTATVVALSFLITLLVSFTFLICRAILGYFVGGMILSIDSYLGMPLRLLDKLKKVVPDYDGNRSLENMFISMEKLPKLISAVPVKTLLPLSLAVSAILFSIVLWYSRKEGDPNAFSNALAISIYVFILLLSLWRRFIVVAVSFVAAIAFYVLIISLMFNSNYYATFLKLTGFGGGVEVSVTLNDGKQFQEMKLLLRSSEWLIGKSLDGESKIEIPTHSVVKITQYGANKALQRTSR
jgi:hypothetical protein